MQEVVSLVLLSLNTWQPVRLWGESQVCLRGIKQRTRVNGQELQQGQLQLDLKKIFSQKRYWTLILASQRSCEDGQNSKKLRATWSSFEVSHALSRAASDDLQRSLPNKIGLWFLSWLRRIDSFLSRSYFYVVFSICFLFDAKVSKF